MCLEVPVFWIASKSPSASSFLTAEAEIGPPLIEARGTSTTVIAGALDGASCSQ